MPDPHAIGGTRWPGPTFRDQYTPAEEAGMEAGQAESEDRWAGLTHEQVRELAALVNAADEGFMIDGGGTRHWVRDHFLPELESARWTITPPTSEEDK